MSVVECVGEDNDALGTNTVSVLEGSVQRPVQEHQ